MERWDLYTEDRVCSGRMHERGQEIPKGYYHLVVHVWIRSREGKFLISQRAADRPTFPLFWECVGGSVIAGEDSLRGALREAAEEVGILLEASSGRLVYSRIRDEIGGVRFGDILDVWLFEYDGEVDLKRATEREVEQVKWMTAEEIRALYDAGRMVHTLGYFFERIAV